MHFLKCLVVGCVMTFSLTGCQWAITDGKSLAVRPSDGETIKQATSYAMNAPLLTDIAPGQSLHLYKVAFDGTMNDRDHVPVDERETLVSRIARATGAVYYSGAGMQDHRIDRGDALFGTSVPGVARKAADAFYQQAKQWNTQDPDSVIRVFVTGFSRGSAAARQFMNLINDEWTTRFPQAKTQPHFYAMLYDTVATGQHDKLDLDIPVSLDYLVHFIAIDETRNLLFSPSIEPSLQPSNAISRAFEPQRINTIYLPGAHSDVGASYQQGIGDLYIVLTEQFLFMMGIAPNNCWNLSYDPLLNGKHDSRGLVDKLLGSPNPGYMKQVDRPALWTKIKPQTLVQYVANMGRLRLMSAANSQRGALLDVSKVETGYARFSIVRDDKGVQVLEASDLVIPSSVSTQKTDKGVYLYFWVNYGTRYSKLLLSEDILSALSPTPQVLSYTLLETQDQTTLAIWVDNRIVKMMSVTSNIAPYERLFERCYPPRNGQIVVEK